MSLAASPRLTIGVAWNGVGDPLPCLRAGEAAPFVAEVLVAPMDAAAADKALFAARALAKTRVLPPGDTGIYSAWNKLVAACATSHIAFHGIDDLVIADPAIGAALATIRDEDVLVASVRFATPQGQPTAIYHHRESDPPALALGRVANPAGPEVCWPVAVVRAVGGLDESFRIAGDVDLWFRVRRVARRSDVDTVLLTMNDGGISTVARHARTVWLENRRIAHAHGQPVPLGNRLRSGAFLNGRYWLARLVGARTADHATDAARRLVGKPPRYSLVHAK